MSESGGSDSDDSMSKAKDWEMVYVISSSSSIGVCTEGLDNSENFIFPPSRHEGLPIETTEGLSVENSQQGSNELAQIVEGSAENEVSGGRGFESPGVKGEFGQESRSLSEVQDLGIGEGGENEDVCGSKVGENFGLEEEEDLGFLSGFKGFGSGVLESFSCEGWWKRRVDSLGRPNALWSIAMAAALVGIVVLGQRWRSEKWKNQQIRKQLCANDEDLDMNWTQNGSDMVIGSRIRFEGSGGTVSYLLKTSLKYQWTNFVLMNKNRMMRCLNIIQKIMN